MNESLPHLFPWRDDQRLQFGEPLPGGYWTGLYGQIGIAEGLRQDGPAPKTETVKGRQLPAGQHRLTIAGPSIVPVMAHTDTGARLGRRVLPLVANRLRHLRFDQPYDGTIGADVPLVVGDPVPRGGGPDDGARLVLVIFVDGLSEAVLRSAPDSALMPRVTSYFADGLRFRNCYATAEWTLPNVASMFTGRYPASHNMFHPRRAMVLGPEPTLSEAMADAGYLTVNVGANWRATPAHGYSRGFARTVYSKNMSAPEVINDFVDQVTALPGRDVFALLSFMDIHWPCEDVLPDYWVQSGKALDPQLLDPAGPRPLTVRRGGYDVEMIDGYVHQIRRLDRVLGDLLDFVSATYRDSTVILFSDHGQSFGSRFDHSWELPELRLRVPLMVRGRGIPAGQPEEFVELVDIPAIALHGVSPGTGLGEGNLPACLGGQARAFAVAETRYPGRLYRAAVITASEKFMLCSEGTVDDDGAFTLGTPHRHAYRRDSEEGTLTEVPWRDWITDAVVARAGRWMKR